MNLWYLTYIMWTELMKLNLCYILNELMIWPELMIWTKTSCKDISYGIILIMLVFLMTIVNILSITQYGRVGNGLKLPWQITWVPHLPLLGSRIEIQYRFFRCKPGFCVLMYKNDMMKMMVMRSINGDNLSTQPHRKNLLVKIIHAKVTMANTQGTFVIHLT
jgi:hypothetical protein